MQKATAIDHGLAAQIIARIKVMANLNIAEKRLPQDSRIRATLRGVKLD